jgi:hypothetical protein
MDVRMDGSWLRKKGWMDEGGYFDFQFWDSEFLVFVFWRRSKSEHVLVWHLGTLVLCTTETTVTIKLCGL